MSQGKYSPNMPNPNGKDFGFNCFGMPPHQWNFNVENAGVEYDHQNMMGGFDCYGFDSYGYSAFNEDGTYAGDGDGVDRNGITADEYMQMSIEEYQSC